MSLRKKYPKEYKVYANMKRNCYPGYTTTTSYEIRGIKICSEWIKGGFKAFLNDMGTKPSDSHKLLRIDPKKDFCKDNCVWSLQSPKRHDNIMITLNDITETLYYWCNKYNLDYGNTHKKLKRQKFKEAPEKTLKNIINNSK